MPGILPDIGNGGVIIRNDLGVCLNPPGILNAYCPNADFLSSCQLTALPSDCTARITAAQINGIVSELIAFAECLNPEGTWVCNSVQNLCTAWNAWKTGTGPGSLGASVAAAIAFEDCNGAPILLGAALATCADLAAGLASIIIPVDRYVVGLQSYSAVTHAMTLQMSTVPNISIDMSGVINDAIAQHTTAHDTSLSGTGQPALPLAVVQATTIQLGGAALATQAEVNAGAVANKMVTPATLNAATTVLHVVTHDTTLTGAGTTGSPLGVSGAVGAFSSIVMNNLTDISPSNVGAGQISVVGNSYIAYWAMDAVGLHIGTNTTSRVVTLDVDETSKLIVEQAAVKPGANNVLSLGTATFGWTKAYLVSGGQIDYGNGNFTETHSAGLLTMSGGLTVSGAFTSLGIDDNATGERFEISDTGIKFGVLNSNYTLQHVDNDMILEIGCPVGGGGAYGGVIQMYGGDHATRPGYVIIGGQLGVGTGGALGYLWIPASGQHQFYDGVGAPTLEALINGSANYFAGVTRFGQNITNTPGNSNNTAGAALGSGGMAFSGSGGAAVTINKTIDGTLISFASGGTAQGIISVAGATVTYGAFAGSHDSQLEDMSMPDLLPGSILSTIGMKCVWLGVEYEDVEGNTHTSEKVPEGAKVGDVIDFEYTHDVEVRTLVPEEREETETKVVQEKYDDFEVVDGVVVVRKKTRPQSVPVYDEMDVYDSKGHQVFIDVQETDKSGELVFDDIPVLDKKGRPILRTVPMRDENGAIVFQDVPVLVDGEPVTEVVDGEERTKMERVIVTHEVPRVEHLPRMKKVPKIAKVARKKTVTNDLEKVERQTVTDIVKGRVVLLRNDVLTKVEVCKEPFSRKVYGSFMVWDDQFPGDMRTVSLGAWKVRMRAGEFPIDGDWVVSSDVEGCGMMLDPDTAMTARIQSALVAKVTDGTPIDEYEDGSFTVACTYHCG